METEMAISLEEIEAVMGDEMTRINLVPVEELSDQHLIREYNELPRCLKQDIDIKDAPDSYTLGTGHMKWARKHWCFLVARYKLLCKEMDFRGFNRNFTWQDLTRFFQKEYPKLALVKIFYVPTEWDIAESRGRIISKIKEKPDWYRWTNRPVPSYLHFAKNKSVKSSKEKELKADDKVEEKIEVKAKTVKRETKPNKKEVKTPVKSASTKTPKTSKSTSKSKASTSTTSKSKSTKKVASSKKEVKK